MKIKIKKAQEAVVKILKKYKNMRCICCGSKMSPWNKTCPECGEPEVRSKANLNAYKKKVIFTYCGVFVSVIFIVFSSIYLTARENTYQKFHKRAKAYAEAEGYELSLQCYEMVLNKYPGCRRAKKKITKTVITMYEEGVIESREEGYSYYQKYYNILPSEYRSKIWNALYP